MYDTARGDRANVEVELAEFDRRLNAKTAGGSRGGGKPGMLGKSAPNASSSGGGPGARAQQRGAAGRTSTGDKYPWEREQRPVRDIDIN